MSNHELTLPLEPGQTTLVLPKNCIVNDIHALVTVGYYAGEDVPKGSPWKIALRPAADMTVEAGFTEIQLLQIFRFLADWFGNRFKVPHQISDGERLVY